MKTKINLNKRLFSVLSSPLAIAERPFKLWAGKLNMKEEDLLEIIKRLVKKGAIRRFGAVLNHRKIGLKDNVLVAWKIEDKRIDSAAQFICGFSEVSHCYERKTDKDWPYNLYTMIHCSSKNDCLDIVKDISQRLRIKDYRLLFTEKEFKKTRFKF